MTSPRSDALSAVAALDEPTRRRLYEHVIAKRVPVGRDEAATALGLPRQTAAFHLDRLAAAGLLEVGYERRTLCPIGARHGSAQGRARRLE